MILQRANKILQPPAGVTLTFENGILTANGNVTNDWFADAQKTALALGGINEFKRDFTYYFELVRRIKETKISFNCGTTDFAEGQAEKIETLRKDIESLVLSGNSKIHPIIYLVGFANETGTETANIAIKKARAEKVLNELTEKSDIIKKAKESGSEITFSTIPSVKSADSNCEVSFNIKFQA
jgi:OOP family OmpA-OmpF porin